MRLLNDSLLCWLLLLLRVRLGGRRSPLPPNEQGPWNRCASRDCRLR